jgi:hypothetical protein
MIAGNRNLQLEFHADAGVFAGKGGFFRRGQRAEKALQIFLAIIKNVVGMDKFIHATRCIFSI